MNHTNEPAPSSDQLSALIQDKARRECLITTKCNLKLSIKEIERIFGNSAWDVNVALVRALMAIEKFTREPCQ